MTSEQPVSEQPGACTAERLDALLEMLALPFGRYSAVAELCRLAARWKRDPGSAPNRRRSAKVRRLAGAFVEACAPSADDCARAFYGVGSEDACDVRASLLIRGDALAGLVRLLEELRDVLRAIEREEQPFGTGGASSAPHGAGDRRQSAAGSELTFEVGGGAGPAALVSRPAPVPAVGLGSISSPGRGDQ